MDRKKSKAEEVAESFRERGIEAEPMDHTEGQHILIFGGGVADGQNSDHREAPEEGGGKKPLSQ